MADETKRRKLILTSQKILFKGNECQILTIRDISAQKELKKSEEKNSLLNLLTSSVSHELMTPIRCIITFATLLLNSLKNEAQKNKATNIINTGKLLQSQIKMLLDRSLLENGQFRPQLQNCYILKTIKEMTEILQSQATLRKIKIVFEPKCAEV